jgi:hypothetical protein
MCPLEGIRIAVKIEVTSAYDWNRQRTARLTPLPLKIDYPNLYVMYEYLLYRVLYDYILDSPGYEYQPSRCFTCLRSARNFLESLKRICLKFVQVITLPFWSMSVPLLVNLLAKCSEISCCSARSSSLTITASASQLAYPYTTYEVTEDSQ